MEKFSRPIGLAVLALAFLATGIAGGASNPIDATIIREMAQWRSETPRFTQFVHSFTDLGAAPVTLGAAAIACISLLGRRLPAAALLLAITVVGERLLVDLVKDWTGRLRPSLELLWHLPQSMAFPSGHAANSMTAFLAIAMMATSARWRWAACVAALTLSLLLGLSRVYLGVHWPSDVIGGWAFGLLAVGCALEIGRRSGALPLEPEHYVVGGHLAPAREDKSP